MEYRERQWQREGVHKRIRQEWVPLALISPYAVKAVIIAEEDKFRSHEGFDFEAIYGIMVRRRIAIPEYEEMLGEPGSAADGRGGEGGVKMAPDRTADTPAPEDQEEKPETAPDMAAPAEREAGEGAGP